MHSADAQVQTGEGRAGKRRVGGAHLQRLSAASGRREDAHGPPDGAAAAEVLRPALQRHAALHRRQRVRRQVGRIPPQTALLCSHTARAHAHQARSPCQHQGVETTPRLVLQGACAVPRAVASPCTAWLSNTMVCGICICFGQLGGARAHRACAAGPTRRPSLRSAPAHLEQLLLHPTQPVRPPAAAPLPRRRARRRSAAARPTGGPQCLTRARTGPWPPAHALMHLGHAW